MQRKLLLNLRKWLISFESFFYSTTINPSIGQRRRGNVTLVSNVREATPIFLFWVLKGLDELLEMRFEFPLQLDWQIDNTTYNRPTMARIQILVHRWVQTKDSVLFRRPT